MKRIKILLLEDDKVTQILISNILGSEFEVMAVSTIEQAQEMLEKFDSAIKLAIVDRTLPDGDGLNFCSTLKSAQNTSHIPVLFLSALGSELDKVGGFYAGADDYVTKPFSPLELKARVKARVKDDTNHLIVSNVKVDLISNRVLVDDVEVDLTRIEFKLLVIFLKSLDHVYSREYLLNSIWGQSLHVSDRVVDTHLSHLRRKLKSSNLELESIRGEGYRIVEKSRATKIAS